MKVLSQPLAQVCLKDVSTPLYVCCIGLKGDWPALTKLGNLVRHHGREAHVKDGLGICHLCAAGQRGHDFHKFGYDEMLRSRTAELPWSKPSSLVSVIPQSPSKLEKFFKIDVFHSCHKGVMGDICANAIVTCTYHDFCLQSLLSVSLACCCGMGSGGCIAEGFSSFDHCRLLFLICPLMVCQSRVGLTACMKSSRNLQRRTSYSCICCNSLEPSLDFPIHGRSLPRFLKQVWCGIVFSVYDMFLCHSIVFPTMVGLTSGDGSRGLTQLR